MWTLAEFLLYPVALALHGFVQLVMNLADRVPPRVERPRPPAGGR